MVFVESCYSTPQCCYTSTNGNLSFLVFLKAGNESCPQPQTSEHLAAIEIMKLKHIIILQNKIDLVKESQAKEQYDQILKFVQGKISKCFYIEHRTKEPNDVPVSCVECLSSAVPKCIFIFSLSTGTIAEGAPVVPISAQLKYNIEVICEFICKKIPVPVRDFTSDAKLIGIFHRAKNFHSSARLIIDYAKMVALIINFGVLK